MIEKVKNHANEIGIVAIFIGFVLTYLAYYGHNVYYTHTYNFLTRYVPQFIDIWVLFMGTSMFMGFVIFAVGGGLYAKLFVLQKHRIMRVMLIIFGLATVFVADTLFFASDAFTKVLSKIEAYVYLGLLGTVGLLALVFAAFPKLGYQIGRIKKTSFSRLLAFGMALVIGFLVVTLLEIQVMDPPDRQVLHSQSGSPVEKSAATHFLFFTVEPKYRQLRVGESVPLTLTFKAFDRENYDPGTKGAYPIALNPDHKYAVTINARSLGFEISAPTSELLSNRPIISSEVLSWNWIIAPKEGKEGNEQVIVFEAFIYDLTTKSFVAESPFTMVSIGIGTPLGLPTWLISPQIGIGTMLGGLIATVLPWALGEFRRVRESQRVPSQL